MADGRATHRCSRLQIQFNLSDGADADVWRAIVVGSFTSKSPKARGRAAETLPDRCIGRKRALPYNAKKRSNGRAEGQPRQPSAASADTQIQNPNRSTYISEVFRLRLAQRLYRTPKRNRGGTNMCLEIGLIREVITFWPG